jgi:hypothetical protein
LATTGGVAPFEESTLGDLVDVSQAAMSRLTDNPTIRSISVILRSKRRRTYYPKLAIRWGK